jgi:hypothetical protein
MAAVAPPVSSLTHIQQRALAEALGSVATV